MANIVVEGPGSRNIADVLDLDFGGRRRKGKRPAGGSSRGDGLNILVSKPQREPRRFTVRRPQTSGRPFFDEQGPAQLPSQPAAPRRPPASAPANRMRRSDMNAMLADFADPAKTRDDFEDNNDDELEDPGSVDDEMTGSEEGSLQGDDEVEDIQPEDGSEFDPLKPSPGFASIDDEKSDLLFKIQRYKKQGRYSSKQFNIFSDIRELRAEVARIRTDIDVESSIKFQRKLLMAVVSGIEFGNKKFKLADLHLDGWSEHVHGEIESYDTVFEELYYKYRGKTTAPPEIRLLLMVGGSALMYSMSQTMFKAAMPRIQDVLNKNPELVNQMATAYANTATQHAVGGEGNAAEGAGDGKPRPMRGPGLDIASMMGGLPFPTPGGESAGDFLAPPVSARTLDRARPNPLFTQQARDEDRMSDVISEDLESVRSLDSSRSGGSKRAREDSGNGPSGKKVVIIK